MIRLVETYEPIEAFAASFRGDPVFSDPMLSTPEQVEGNLRRSIEEPERCRTIAVYEEDTMTGLFSFLVIPGERYLEMLVGLSREAAAYTEMIAYLKENFPGHHADFVYNPNNYLMASLLKNCGAEFYPAQSKMLFTHAPLPKCPQTIVPLTEEYLEGYRAIHDDTNGRYWTVDRLLDATHKFRTFLALHEGRVVGFTDVTYCFDENEPFDLFVCPEFRRMGYGRALMAAALEANEEKGMMLLVDNDNIPAIRLYDSMGFQEDPLGANQTAFMVL